MHLTSPAFRSGESGAASTVNAASTIPARYAMRAVPGGENVSLPYEWTEAPPGTKSFALTLVDAAPVAHGWVHWAVVDISASATGLPEGASGTATMPQGAVELDNAFGFAGYGGPQPPVGTGVHPYVATVYALDVAHLDVAQSPSATQLERALASHVLANATCVGVLGR